MKKPSKIDELKKEIDKLITRRLYDIANIPLEIKPNIWTELTDLRNKINKL